jgi:hypothetical protein
MRMWEKSSELAGFEASREGNLDPTAPAETSSLQPLTIQARGADPGLQQPFAATQSLGLPLTQLAAHQ